MGTRDLVEFVWQIGAGGRQGVLNAVMSFWVVQKGRVFVLEEVYAPWTSLAT